MTNVQHVYYSQSARKKAFAAATQNGFPCNSRLSTKANMSLIHYLVESHARHRLYLRPPEQMIVHEPHTLRAEL